MLETIKNYLIKRLDIPTNITIELIVEPLSVEATGGGYSYPDGPDKYVIVIDSESCLEYQSTVLVHEMRHVWQYVTGKLRDYEFDSFVWEDKKYMTNHFKGYWEAMPHENDANRYEWVMWHEIKSLLPKE
jgi:hypothetical protein